MTSPIPQTTKPTTATATLKYILPLPLYATEKPFEIFTNIPSTAPDQRTSNLVFEEVKTPVEDVRGREEQFTLDGNGFQFVRHETVLGEERSREVIERVYLPEVEMLLRREVEGVGRVWAFDWRLRKTMKADVMAGVMDLNDHANWLRPAVHVHVDQAPSAVLNRIKAHFGDEAEELLKGRVRVINVWRPLIKAVKDWPLAVCDSNTVYPKQLIETDHVRRHYTGSTMYLAHDPAQKFYFMSEQGKEDVLLFKNFDSRRGIPGKYAPHSSFEMPGFDIDEVEPRESIEVRTIVFTDVK